MLNLPIIRTQHCSKGVEEEQCIIAQEKGGGRLIEHITCLLGLFVYACVNNVIIISVKKKIHETLAIYPILY